MTSDSTNDLSSPRTGSEAPGTPGSAQPATVIVRGEAVQDQKSQSLPQQAPATRPNDRSAKEVSEAKVQMQQRLPSLKDDADVGLQKDQLVVRDGKADLAFVGTLLASAAPASAPEGHWEEYRVYETNGGKHVFSKVTRHIKAEAHDEHKAEVFDPDSSSVSSQLLRSARELTHSRPPNWTDAAVKFFGYDPLAKALYRKLGRQFEEHIS